MSRELYAATASRFSQLNGILQWAMEIGRLDICTKVSTLSQHFALPREGHLEMAYHIFPYLKKKLHAKLVFDDAMPRINESTFHNDCN